METRHLYLLYILVISLIVCVVVLFMISDSERVKETLYSTSPAVEDLLSRSNTFTDIFTDIAPEKDSIIRIRTRNVSENDQISFRLVDSLSGDIISKVETLISDQAVELRPKTKQGRNFDLEYKTTSDNIISIARITYEYKI